MAKEPDLSPEFVEALSRALTRPDRRGDPIPGLPVGEEAPALWGIQHRLEQAHGGELMAGIQEETRRWLAGEEDADDGPRSA